MPPSNGLPSVTHILDAMGLGPDFSRVRPEDLERARQRGSLVHAAIELHGYGAEPEPLPAEAQPYFDGYLKFVRDTWHEPIVSEYEVTSTRWGFVGHLDRVGWLDAKRTLFDWKNTAVMDDEYVGWQLAGYRAAWNEQRPKEPIEQLVGVQLRADGTYRLFPITAVAQAESVFLSAVTVYRARAARNGGQ